MIWKTRSDRDSLLGKRARLIVVRSGIHAVAVAMTLVVVRTEAALLLKMLVREGSLVAIPMRGRVPHRNSRIPMHGRRHLR
jgi:hypothetical protein